MRLIPGDLGLYWQVRLIQARDNPGRVGSDLPPARSGWLTSWYGQGAGLSEDEAAALVPVSSTTIGGNLAGFGAMAYAVLALGGGIAGAASNVDPGAGILIAFVVGTLPAFAIGAMGARSFLKGLLRRPLGEEGVGRAPGSGR